VTEDAERGQCGCSPRHATVGRRGAGDALRSPSTATASGPNCTFPPCSGAQWCEREDEAASNRQRKHQINRIDFGFKDLEMNSNSVHHVFDGMLQWNFNSIFLELVPHFDP
jgi:hypothetical protein